MCVRSGCVVVGGECVCVCVCEYLSCNFSLVTRGEGR